MPGSKHILICGAGIAGPALARLLVKAGHRCTVVERASKFRDSGQQIDISGEGLKVIKTMGVEDTIRENTVKDDGINFVNAKNEVIASFPVGKADLVREIEIMRGDLARIFYDRTKDDVEYIFGDFVSGVVQHENSVTVSFTNLDEKRDFDLIVAADGIRSKTREIVFGPDNTKIVSLGMFSGFYSIPWKESDSTWSRWFNATKGRCVCLRPDKKRGITGAYLSQATADSGGLPTMSTEEQRNGLVELFKDVGWEADRMLEDLQSVDAQLYMLEVAQVKCSTWVKDRVVLLGDAGYCPSPVSGQGTTLALVGAYMLAGCIATYQDVHEALDQYQKQMRPFVDSSQKLPPGVPWIVNPQSALGISVMNNLLWITGFAINSGIASALGKLSRPLTGLFGGQQPKLPNFPVFAVTDHNRSVE